MSAKRVITTLPTKNQVVSLYHKYLRTANKFDNYNFREFFLRKAKHDFRDQLKLTDNEQIIKAYNKALVEYDVLKRQATISEMYHFEKSVVERID